MKIAVSSQNFRTITGHAGKGRRFLIYESGDDGLVECGRLDLPKGKSIHDTKGEDSHPLDEVDVLVTAGCGSGFVVKMAKRNVRVLKTEEQDPMTAAKMISALDL